MNLLSFDVLQETSKLPWVFCRLQDSFGRNICHRRLPIHRNYLQLILYWRFYWICWFCFSLVFPELLFRALLANYNAYSFFLYILWDIHIIQFLLEFFSIEFEKFIYWKCWTRRLLQQAVVTIYHLRTIRHNYNFFEVQPLLNYPNLFDNEISLLEFTFSRVVV